MSLSALVDLFGALKESTSLLGLIPEKDVAEHLTSSKKSEQKLQMVMALENSRARLANNRKMLLGNAEYEINVFALDVMDLVGFGPI